MSRLVRPFLIGTLVTIGIVLVVGFALGTLYSGSSRELSLAGVIAFKTMHTQRQDSLEFGPGLLLIGVLGGLLNATLAAWLARK